MVHTGRRLTKRFSALRRPTLTLVNPPPTGVVTGPLSATVLRSIESSSSGGSGDVVALDRPHACQLRLPLSPQTRRLENRDDRARDLGADAVAFDERDAVHHALAFQTSLMRVTRALPRRAGPARRRD